MDEPPLPSWVADEALARVWGLVGERLERRGLIARGQLEIHDLSRSERHALTDLLGRPVTTVAVRLNLADLDRRLVERLGVSLATATSRVLGRPLEDRPADRAAMAQRRAAPFTAASDWLAAHTIETSGWVEAWLTGLRRDGVLASSAGGVEVMLHALQVLVDRQVIGDSGRASPGLPRPISRTELAARMTGSAHGLDDGERLATIILRAAAARVAVGLPRGAEERRALWESLGVVSDAISSTSLVLGLVTQGNSQADARLRLSAQHGVPAHVTWWDVRSDLHLAAGQTVLACENPRVLEAIAERRVPGLGVVCTMGQPNLVVRAVLGLLSGAGARLTYHGDFDWPGVAMANACCRDFGAQPWLMTAADYAAGRGAQSLAGAPVEAEWDPELAPAMRGRGVAVHEEAVIETVLDRVNELRAPSIR